VSQIFEPNDNQLINAVKLADVVKALGIVADSVLLVADTGGHAQGAVLETGVPLQIVACAPN